MVFFSNWKEVSIGLPQGSILGPLLMIVYLNDIPNISPNIFPVMYADDTTLCIRGDSLGAVSRVVNSELSKFYVWCACNRLSINYVKSYCMVFFKL